MTTDTTPPPPPTDWWQSLDLSAPIPDPDYSLVDFAPTLGEIMRGAFGGACRVLYHNQLARSRG